MCVSPFFTLPINVGWTLTKKQSVHKFLYLVFGALFLVRILLQ